MTVSFDSDRAPVWGDFYAKCGATGGIQNTLYNAGFSDPDPLAPPSNGSLQNHLLVPNSVTTHVIPVPGALVLTMLGIGCVGRFRRGRVA